MKEILVNAHPQGKRVAILENGRLMEVYYEGPERERSLGNIYKGVVKGILGGIGSAFVDVGEKQNLFLSQKELNDELLRDRGFKRREAVPIQKVLRSSQSLIIQVKRGSIGSKNPQGTTRISLPGRYWVFLPEDRRLGVSRRIERRREIKRLKRIARELKRPDEGLIARTASIEASKEELERDFNFLLGTWKGIEEEAEKAAPPKLLYEGLDLIKSIIRDRLLDDISQVVVDSESTFNEVLDFLGYMRMADYKDRVKRYQDRIPLFEFRDVERQIRESLQQEVRLPSGGSLVIQEAEALTAIDVNTGSSVRHKNQEMAILNTNLEAALEIPRQLRLRKISGIIVVDFIDMKRKDFVHRVTGQLEEELRKDRVTADFIDITELGLVEITRKREGKSLSGMLEEDS